MGQLVYDYGPHNVNPDIFSEEKEKNEKLYFLAYPTDNENDFTTSIEKFKERLSVKYSVKISFVGTLTKTILWFWEFHKAVSNIIAERMRGNLSKKWCLSDTVKLILFDLKSQMERHDSIPHNPLTQEGTFLI